MRLPLLRATRSPFFQRCLQRLLLHWLGQVVVHSGLQAVLLAAFGYVRRHGNNHWSISMRSPYCFRRVVPVHVWHLAVHEDQVVRLTLLHLDCFFAIARHIGPPPDLSRGATRENLFPFFLSPPQHARSSASRLRSSTAYARRRRRYRYAS